MIDQKHGAKVCNPRKWKRANHAAALNGVGFREGAYVQHPDRLSSVRQVF